MRGGQYPLFTHQLQHDLPQLLDILTAALAPVEPNPQIVSIFAAVNGPTEFLAKLLVHQILDFGDVKLGVFVDRLLGVDAHFDQLEVLLEFEASEDPDFEQIVEDGEEFDFLVEKAVAGDSVLLLFLEAQLFVVGPRLEERDAVDDLIDVVEL